MTTSIQAPADATSRARQRVLATWWDQLVAEDTLATIFADPPATYGDFVRRLEGRPLYAQYQATEPGVELGAVLWGVPWLRGVKLGLWVPAEFRRRRQGLRMIEELLALAFRDFPVLVALAETPERARLYQRYGFQGQVIPEIGPAGDLWLGWMTPATWRRRTKETPA